jgi:hypothetical protein
MTGDESSARTWAGMTFWVDDTARLGRLRVAALLTILEVYRVSTRTERHGSGLASIDIYGRAAVVDHLRGHLDELLAQLDAAGRAGARRYGAWLRGQDEPDHMRAERRNLTRAYRREYLTAWADAYALRLLAVVRDDDRSEVVEAVPVGHHRARAAASADVAQLDPAGLEAAAAVLHATDLRRQSTAPAVDAASPAYLDGPGRVTAGQRVSCLPGSLPRRDGGRGGGVLVSVGPKTSVVDVYGGTRRRIPNELLHPDVGWKVAAERRALGLPTTTPSGRGWLPGWSWLEWTVAEHLQYTRGERSMPMPPPAPIRLVIVACGSRKKNCIEAAAGEMYVGSYHLAARRAATAIATPGTRVMVLSYASADVSGWANAATFARTEPDARHLPRHPNRGSPRGCS